jgi:WD40 repeat protein/tRNA A-37 threonylcarbamoyl transferase component Bud32
MARDGSTGGFDPPDYESVLGDVIAAYLRSVESGQPPSREALIEQHPELAEELSEFFANHDRLEQLAQPLRVAASPAPEQTEKHNPSVRYFGDYELLEQIAQGGMGVVYKARQLSLNRLVAVKMIRSGLLATDADVKRFSAEAEAAANLRHPGIVPIYEVGVHDGQHYYSMEYVEGRDLSQIVHDNPLAPAKAAAYVRDMAEIVEYSHREGVVHRDLKPANVLIDGSDRVRITDFGLAKRVGSDADLTTTGQVIGTPKYMSPEQAAAQHALIGPASDVYALGSILYELLTGRAPFRSDSAIDILRQIQEDDPVRPQLLNARLPKDLETICLKCLEKEPRRRYASAQDLADELGRYLRGEPIKARPLSRTTRAVRWCRRKPVAASLLAALVAGTATTTWQAVRATLAEKATEIALADVTAENKRANTNEAKAIELANKEARLREQAQIQAAKLMFEQGWSKYEQGDMPHAVLLMARCLVNLDALEHAAGTNKDSVAPEAIALSHSVRTHLLQLSLHSNCPRVTFAHNDGVRVMAFSPDGTKLATWSDDQTARLWDVATGEPLGEPLQHTKLDGVLFWDVATGTPMELHSFPIFSLAFSPDGTKLATASWDNTARLWDVATGKPLGDALQHADSVIAVVFSPDGTKLATASHKTARVWDVATGKPLGDALQHAGSVIAVAFSADGTKLATASHLWDVATGKPLADALQHEANVEVAAFSPDGTKLATGSWPARAWGVPTALQATDAAQAVDYSHDGMKLGAESTVRVWDVATRKPLHALQYAGRIMAVAFSPDGMKLATASEDKTARLWDVATGQPVGDALQHEANVVVAAFSPDGAKLATGSWDKTARLWDAATGKPLGGALQHADRIMAVAFSADGTKLATASHDKSARLWDVAPTTPIANVLHHQEEVKAVAFSLDGTTVAASSSYVTRFWDAVTGQPLGNFPLHLAPNTSIVAFSPDGTKLAQVRNKTADLWDVATGKRLEWDVATGKRPRYALQHEDTIHAAAFSPDGTKLATAGGRTAQLWDLATGRRLGDALECAPPGEGWAGAVAFSPDGTKFATAFWNHRESWGTSVRIWNLPAGRPLGATLNLEGRVRHLAFNPDSAKLATASDDQTARLWDLGTGEQLGETLEHKREVISLAFSSDGTKLATGSMDNTARLWDVATGKPLGDPLQHTDFVRSVAFSPDGTKLATGSWDKTARVWKVPGELSERADHVYLWLETLTGATESDAGVFRQLTFDEMHHKHDELFEAGGPPRAYLEALEKRRQHLNSQ